MVGTIISSFDINMSSCPQHIVAANTRDNRPPRDRNYPTDLNAIVWSTALLRVDGLSPLFKVSPFVCLCHIIWKLIDVALRIPSFSSNSMDLQTLRLKPVAVSSPAPAIQTTELDDILYPVCKSMCLVFLLPFKLSDCSAVEDSMDADICLLTWCSRWWHYSYWSPGMPWNTYVQWTIRNISHVRLPVATVDQDLNLQYTVDSFVTTVTCADAVCTRIKRGARTTTLPTELESAENGIRVATSNLNSHYTRHTWLWDAWQRLVEHFGFGPGSSSIWFVRCLLIWCSFIDY